MTLIERYIALRITRMSLAAVLPLLAVIWIVQVLGRINLVTDSGQSIGSFFKLAGLIMPTVLPMVLPFGIVIGVAQTLAAMNSDSELAVIDAAGTSRLRLLRPVIIVGLAASLISFGVTNVLEPIVRLEARKMIAAVYADLLSSVIEEKTFRKIENGLYLQISHRVQGRALRGLFVADYREPGNELIYYAKEGAVDKNGTTLVMRDGEVDRRTADGNLSVVRFDSYAFDLSELSHANNGQMPLRPYDRTLPFLFNPDPNDPDVQRNPNDYRAEFHRRLTEWSFPLVYGLVAFLVAGHARTQREIRTHPAVLAMTAAFLLRWVSYYFSNRIVSSAIFIWPLYVLPLVLLVGCTVLILRARTLFLYFFRHYMKTVMWFFIGVAAITFLIDFSENSGRLSAVKDATVPLILWLTVIRLPLLIQQTVPFIILFASMVALIALNRKYELVVTRAAGISVWQFMMPFVVGAGLVGILTTTVLNPLAAAGMAKSLGMEAHWTGNSGTRSLDVPWLHQFSHGDDAIIGAQGVSENGTELSGVVIFHFDPQGNITLRQDAQTAKLEHGFWLLNAVTETRPGEPPKHLETVQVPTNLNKEFVQERLSQPETVGFFDIPHKVDAARALGISSLALQTQYQSLLSLPLLLVAMAMIAGTVSLKFSRFSQSSLMILSGIMAGFMLYVVTMLVKAFGSSGVVPPFVAAWIPVIAAMSIGATILLHQEDG